MVPTEQARPAPLQPADFGTSADFGGLLSILRRNLGKIVMATLAGLMLALAYLSVATPLYTATASVFVDPRTRKIVSEEIIQGGFGSDLALVESQVSILTSDAVLKRVVEKLELDKDAEFAPPSGRGMLSRLKALIIPRPSDPDKAVLAIKTLSDIIKVKRAQKTYVVDVEVTASRPEKAQKVAEALVEAYLADQTAAKAAEAKRANALIDARLGELRDQVRQAETRVDEFKKANRILTSEGGIVTEQQLTKINGELIIARAVAAESKARYEQVQQALDTGMGPESLPDAVRSGLVQKLREQFSQVARREASLSTQLRSKHPVLVDVRSQLVEVKNQINDELQRVSAAAKGDHEIAANRVEELARQLEQAKDEVIRTNTAQIKLRELDQEVTASRELLRLFLGRAKETQEQQNVSTPDARVITAPSIPSRPSKPMSWLVLGLGLIGGLGLGLASALVSDHLDQSIRLPRELAALLGGPGISTIPVQTCIRDLSFGALFGRGKFERVQAAQFSELLTALTAISNDGGSGYRQTILRLLAKIKSQHRPGRPQTVLFTSANAQAGNSATALSLAYAAALAGERVLLVDATSANPELSQVFASQLEAKSVTALDNKEQLAAITTIDAPSGLVFLPIALADLRTFKNAQRRRLIAGLNGLSQGYDMIFIDAGGVLADESAACLLPSADQIMIVARNGLTTRNEIAAMLEILEPARPRLTGGILTMVD